ncbi:hypothetical protein EUX98_g9291 [Antrodiella citrinella]|uniref:CxC2-like cysteine cluster KDZ transposase-associated domain-containing protein n=1 Tax=Antrodiella citrinella TaxID=2447956 RepID=A0A4S4LXM1_9APHY|nr:hypothetical protein EUX98_g9291 [Antrodiella citrinella]
MGQGSDGNAVHLSTLNVDSLCADHMNRWIYTLFLMIDANFKLKLKDKGIRDLELAPGWAYYVNEDSFQKHIDEHHRKNGDAIEENTCSAEHNAILKANLRKEGYIASGVGAVFCARHCLVRPNGVGDLQKGEQFSLNYVQWVGRTYGEGIESAWHVFNSVSMATREMGPAMRHEVLNDHWGSWNWEKILGFGLLMSKSFLEAQDMMTKQTQRFEDLNATFTKETISRWSAQLTRWNNDPTVKPDPFEELESRNTLQEIRAKLAEEDTRDTARGAVVLHKVSPSVFLHMGLEIEDQQRRLRVRATGSLNATALTSLQEKRSTLARRIELWRKTQAIYLPVATPLYAASSDPSASPAPSRNDGDGDDADASPATLTKAEDITLWLPSELPSNLMTADYIKIIAAKECEFRKAQAFDALANIRRICRIITGITEFKKLNLVNEGQRTSTRLRSYYDKFKQQIDHSASRYRAARNALLVLDPTGDWTIHLKVLHADDIRGPLADKDDALKEGRRELSWIWLVQHASSPEDGFENDFCEGMRVEWAKAKARAERWSEEVKLLQEEMRRVLEFLSWKAAWWRSQVNQRAGTSPTLKEGLSAYAEKQARVHEDLRKSFASRWYQVLGTHQIMPPWKVKYLGSEEIPILPNVRLRVSKRTPMEESGDEEEEEEEEEDGDDGDDN